MKEKIAHLLQEEIRRRKKEKEKYLWDLWARPEQKMPQGSWRIWLILAGRGFGKTRTGAETIRAWAQKGLYKRICLLGHHFDDVRRIMIEGESGLLSVSSPEENLLYSPSKRSLLWPSGTQAFAYSATSPSHLRGPQFDAVWIDELAKFPQPQEVWDQVMLCLRLGTQPRIIITTTPRPLPFLKKLIERPDIVITRGSTFHNEKNLSEAYLHELRYAYNGTQLASQEIQGELVEDTADYLFHPSWITYRAPPEELERVVVAIDPAVTHHSHSDETGIIVAGIDHQGYGYILDDLSGHFSPTQWIERAVEAYDRYKADRILAETNNGGDLVQHLLHSLYPNIPYKSVQATRSKKVRAEPIAALYEQGKISHIRSLPLLEGQMIRPSQARSPDRLDALVWALTELFFHRPPSIRRL